MRSLGAVLRICLALLIGSSLALAEDATETTSVKKERYLGVVTEPVSEALAAQLKGMLAPGRGLLVKRVLPDSPAAKAGLEPFDVLSSAETKPLSTPEQFKELITSQPAGRSLKLEVIRNAKALVLDVLPAERTVSRMIHRHAGTGNPDPVDPADSSVVRRKDSESKERDELAQLPAYSVGVLTRDGKNFQVEVRLSADSPEAVTQKYAGTSAEVAPRLRHLPAPVQRSVLRQMNRISEDRQTLRTVQFRFQPQRQGNRQVLAVTLRMPDANGAVKSFELQQPMGDVAEPLALERVLAIPDFVAQLRELDPAVREKIAATLKTAALPAATLKVEQSQ